MKDYVLKCSVLMWLIGLMTSVQAVEEVVGDMESQIIVWDKRSIDLDVIMAQRVCIAKNPVEQQADDAGYKKYKFEVVETLKGQKQQFVTTFAKVEKDLGKANQYLIIEGAQGKDDVLVVLITKDGMKDVVTRKYTMFEKPEELLTYTKEVINEFAEVKDVKSASFFPLMSELGGISELEDAGSGAMYLRLEVPLTEELEKQTFARLKKRGRALSDGRLFTRISHFKKVEYVELMKDLLDDPYWAVHVDYVDDGREAKKIYNIRYYARNVLMKWGEDVGKVVTEEDFFKLPEDVVLQDKPLRLVVDEIRKMLEQSEQNIDLSLSSHFMADRDKKVSLHFKKGDDIALLMDALKKQTDTYYWSVGAGKLSMIKLHHRKDDKKATFIQRLEDR